MHSITVVTSVKPPYTYRVCQGSAILLITQNRSIAERYAEQLRKRIELAQS